MSYDSWMTSFSQRYLNMQQKYWVGLWSPVLIETPFGKIMPLFPSQDGTLLFECDLNSVWSGDEIVNVVEDTAKRYFGYPGFYFTSAWNGDVQGFKQNVADKGYKPTVHLKNYILKDFKSCKHDDLFIREPDDPEKYSRLYQKCCEASEVERQRIRYLVERSINKTHNTFFLAEQDGNEIGVIACTIDNDIGYYHLLGVDPRHRGKGIGKALASHAIEYLKSNGCDDITCAVRSTAVDSITIQESLGFEEFETWEIWLKT